MNKLLIGLAVMASSMVSTTAFAAEGDVHFKGNLKGFKDSIIVITPGEMNRSKLDTVLVKDGTFDFIVNVSKPTNIKVYTPGTARRTEKIGFEIVAVPGESAEVTGDLTSNYYFSGSKFYQEYNEAEQAMVLAGKPLVDFLKSLDARLAAGESRDTLMKEYQEKSSPLQKQFSDGILNFIRQHPNYEASAAIIPTLGDLDQMKEAVALLSPAVRDGRMKDVYQETIDVIKQQAEAEAQAAKKQEAGTIAPDFTLNDINGKPLSFSSLRGKYVVLDFWGSWCVWCIKGIPDMKKYYEKYKGKFEILGVDCNDTEQKWKDAVKKYELPWLHVYNPRDSKVLEDYGIQGFPTKIIVGPDGKIVKTIVGEDPAFYSFLDETFGK